MLSRSVDPSLPRRGTRFGVSFGVEIKFYILHLSSCSSLMRPLHEVTAKAVQLQTESCCRSQQITSDMQSKST